MKLRYAPRHKRRVSVRFWDPADGRPRDAFTVDISRSGLFISTHTPLPARSRFRFEILDPEQ